MRTYKVNLMNVPNRSFQHERWEPQYYLIGGSPGISLDFCLKRLVY